MSSRNHRGAGSGAGTVQEREENMNVRNGYSPEATTLCRLWLDNDEREYRFTQAAIAEAVRNRETREERIIMLAGRLEDFMKVNAPDLGANVWGDLMNYAVESVDFYTLAALYLDDNEDWERAKASAASA